MQSTQSGTHIESADFATVLDLIVMPEKLGPGLDPRLVCACVPGVLVR